jgi:uncharacterized membrane protein YfcA
MSLIVVIAALPARLFGCPGPTSARTGVLLFGLDIKIAGTLALVVSLPTMLVAFSRYGQDARFAVLRHNMPFVLIMATGSIVGTVLGGLLLGVVPSTVLIPILAALLLISAVKSGGTSPRPVHHVFA